MTIKLKGQDVYFAVDMWNGESHTDTLNKLVLMNEGTMNGYLLSKNEGMPFEFWLHEYGDIYALQPCTLLPG